MELNCCLFSIVTVISNKSRSQFGAQFFLLMCRPTIFIHGLISSNGIDDDCLRNQQRDKLLQSCWHHHDHARDLNLPYLQMWTSFWTWLIVLNEAKLTVMQHRHKIFNTFMKSSSQTGYPTQIKYFLEQWINWPFRMTAQSLGHSR